MGYLSLDKTANAPSRCDPPPHHPARRFDDVRHHVLAQRYVCGSRSGPSSNGQPVRERRQFANSHDELSTEAGELAAAIDGYKLQHRRRFITFEEMLSVIKSLGYRR